METELKNKIIKAQNGDRKILNELTYDNKGLIIGVAKRFVGRGYEFDDLYQIGSIGFIKAIKKFDFSYNVELSTFAVTYIIGEIKRFMRDDGPIKISRQIKEVRSKIIAERRNNEDISIEDLSKRLEISKDEIIMALDSDNCVQSFEEKVGGEELTLKDKIKSNENQEENIINNLAIRQCLDKLNSKEKKVIYLRYYKGQTQRKVAEIIGISQVQVSRIEKKALKNMSEELKEA